MSNGVVRAIESVGSKACVSDVGRPADVIC
jgi:hypothetical protein